MDTNLPVIAISGTVYEKVRVFSHYWETIVIHETRSAMIKIIVQSTPDFGTLYFGEIRFWRHICVAPISSMGL